jgi:hypothetical protein
VSIDNYADVPENNETALLQAVSVQPVSIAIEASGRDFQHYVTVSLLPPPQNPNLSPLKSIQPLSLLQRNLNFLNR